MRILLLLIFMVFTEGVFACDVQKLIIKQRSLRTIRSKIPDNPRDYEQAAEKLYLLFRGCLQENSPDLRLIKLVLDFHISIEGSASEEINSNLNLAYFKFGQRFLDAIMKLPKKDAVFITNGLNFAWENAHYDVIKKVVPLKPIDLISLNKRLGVK